MYMLKVTGALDITYKQGLRNKCRGDNFEGQKLVYYSLQTAHLAAVVTNLFRQTENHICLR